MEKEFKKLGTPTRWSTVEGLCSSPTSEKWNLFLKYGPYWKYMYNAIIGKLFPKDSHGRTHNASIRQDLIEEAVTNACAKVGNFLCNREFKYSEAGKGYFRAFLKQVAVRSAIDTLRRQARYEGKTKDDDAEQKTVSEKKIDGQNNLEETLPTVTEGELDEYDRQHSFERVQNESDENGERKNWKSAKGKKGMFLASFDAPDDSGSDGEPSNFDLASFFDFSNRVLEDDRRWVAKLQIHVIYIALCNLLTDTKVDPSYREMLRMRIGQDMSPGEIYESPQFARMTRGSFDTKMSRAMYKLKCEVAEWWVLVGPAESEFADEKVMGLWRSLLGNSEKRKMGKAMLKLAEGKVGPIK